MNDKKLDVIGLTSNIPDDAMYSLRRNMLQVAIDQLDVSKLRLIACALCKVHDCENCRVGMKTDGTSPFNPFDAEQN